MRHAALVVIFALLALTTLPAAAGEEGPAEPSILEGTRWAVKVTPDAASAKLGERRFDETVVFESSLVTMRGLEKRGFDPTKYTVSKEGDHWAFRAELRSQSDGRAVWSGTVTGATVKGTIEWKKIDGTVVHHSFSGTKVNR